MLFSRDAPEAASGSGSGTGGLPPAPAPEALASGRRLDLVYCTISHFYFGKIRKVARESSKFSIIKPHRSLNITVESQINRYMLSMVCYKMAIQISET